MLLLILFLIVGSMLAYVSQQNLIPVSVQVGPYVFSDIPLFYVIIGSAVSGLLVAYVFFIFHDIGTSYVLWGKKKEIKKNKDEVIELTKQVHQLELENEKLKHRSDTEPEDRNAL